jgi:GNAT superfamily N-acetyltransferase
VSPRKEPKPVDEGALKRVSAGTYRTGDGRFEVEQNSGRWMLVDTTQTNELGLPIIRGPFATLDEARDAISQARSGPAPTSTLGERMRAAKTKGRAEGKAERGVGGPEPRPPTKATPAPESEPEADAEPESRPPPPIEIRRLEPGDDRLVRRLSSERSAFGAEPCGPFAARRDGGDESTPLDHEAARRLLARADVHLLVATQSNEPVGYLLAYEVPRLTRGQATVLIDELRVRQDRRRQGIGTRLVEALRGIGSEREIGDAFLLTSVRGDGAAAAFYAARGDHRSKSATSKAESSIVRFTIGAE